MFLSTPYLITLLKTPKIGMSAIKSINAAVGYKLSNIGELLDAIYDAKKLNARISLPELADLKKAHEMAERTMDNCHRLGVKAIGFNEAKYPDKLKRLADFPIVIYLKGNIESIHAEQSVAIIGTRQPSDFGIRVGKRTSSLFAQQGFSIISGLAIGCDTAGHLGAVESNKPTVAVLASGVDIIYPKENINLSARIIETGGALLSEYEPGTRSFPQQFVARDRIQAGLADGLIVIETGIKGGTMHAVRTAKEMGMPIGCITGHPAALKGFDKIQGNAYLIANGASPLGSQSQIGDFMQKVKPAISLSDIVRPNPLPQVEDKAIEPIRLAKEVISEPLETAQIVEWEKNLADEKQQSGSKEADLFSVDLTKGQHTSVDNKLKYEASTELWQEQLMSLTQELEKVKEELKEQAKVIKLLLNKKDKNQSKKN